MSGSDRRDMCIAQYRIERDNQDELRWALCPRCISTITMIAKFLQLILLELLYELGRPKPQKDNLLKKVIEKLYNILDLYLIKIKINQKCGFIYT